MTKHIRAINVALPILFAGCSAFLSAQEPELAVGGDYAATTTYKAEVDKLAKPVVGKHCVGLVVGIISPEGREIYGYGKTSSKGKLPDGNSFFEIGSITKTFTSLILSKYIDENRLLENQPVQELLPSGKVKVPMRTRPVSLAHLATHSAGFPEMPSNFQSETTYSVDNLFAAVNKVRLISTPGSRWVYSNFGVGLLGYSLCLNSGMKYADLVKKEVLDPLGLKDTAITLNAEQNRRMVQPHSSVKRPVAPYKWKSDAMVAAGGLCASANDLLNYLAAQAGLRDSPLSAAMELSHAVRTTVDGRTRMGLAWFIDKESGFFYHGGETGGCSTYAGFDPKTQTCVVVLANTVSSDQIENIGYSLQKRFAGDRVNSLELESEFAEVAD